MFLEIEKNKLRGRFEGTVAMAILQVLDGETNQKYLEGIYQVLVKFNDGIKLIDNVFKSMLEEDNWRIYEEEFHDKYINILLEEMNKLYFRFGRTDFLSQLSQNYWKNTQGFILQLWKELPEGKSVASNESSFIKIFEDFFNETMKAFPDFMVKQLKDFHNMYRASRYEVFDNYQYIMPDPKYTRDNRWNDDGVAFLYLAYDNDDLDYQKMKLTQKTCFEEIRAEDGEQISVCKFRMTHRRCKILDLSYDDIDYDEQIQKLKEPEIDWKEKIINTIQDDSKLWNKMTAYVKNNNEDAFKQELAKIEKKMGLDKKIQNYVQMQLSKILIGNICDAIFYAVDKKDDPDLEAYIPFRAFSRYLMSQGFGGVAYRSTRMAKINLQGKCLTLFEKNDAKYIDGEMEVYEYHRDSCRFITKY